MLTLLIAFSLFNLFASAGALGHAVRLLEREERRLWRSRTLLALAALLSWTFPLAALAATGFAWTRYLAGDLATAPIIMAPVAWLLLLGGVFAAVDFADDGVIGNARRASPDAD